MPRHVRPRHDPLPATPHWCLPGVRVLADINRGARVIGTLDSLDGAIATIATSDDQLVAVVVDMCKPIGRIEYHIGDERPASLGSVAAEPRQLVEVLDARAH